MKKKCPDCKGKGYHESFNQISICDCQHGKEDMEDMKKW